jgi:hypothetical protein
MNNQKMKNLVIPALLSLAISCGGNTNEATEKEVPSTTIQQKDNNNNEAEKVDKAADSLITTSDQVETHSLPIIPGRYNNGRLLLASDGKIVTGFYTNGRYEGNPNFGCSFYFFGDMVKPVAERAIEIKTLNPFNLSEKARKGRFALHGEEDDIFSLVANLNGDDCWDQALGFADIGTPPGISFTLAEQKNWLEIRIASAEKVYFYKSAEENTKRKAYVVKGDPLLITKRSGEWLKATYPGTRAETTGWLKLAETKRLQEIGPQ